MINIFIKAINQEIDANYGVTNISIENTDYYRLLIYNINDQIILSENNKEIDISKKTIVLSNIFDIDMNEKKMINLLYKHLENQVSEAIKEKFVCLKNQIVNLIEEVSDNSELKLIYNEDIEIIKVFTICQLQFDCFDYKNYVESLLQYLNNLNYFTNIKIFITFGLMSFISNEELIKIKSELELYNITLINFEKFTKEKMINYLIDDDYCVL